MAGNVADAYGVLTENDVVARLRDRHRDYFLELAETAEPQLRRADQVVWLDLLEENHDNMRAALDWCLGQGDVERAARLAGALWRFWFIRGYIPEGRQWLERVVAAGDATAHSSPAFAKALWSTAVMLAWEWDKAAGPLVERAEEMARAHGDARGVYDTFLVRLGQYNGPQARLLFPSVPGFRDKLVAAANEAVAKVDDPELRANANWIISAGAGDWTDEALQRVLQAYREVGDRWAQLWILYFLSVGGGQPSVGTSRLEEALSLAIELGAPFNITFLSDALCWRAALAGDYDLAVSTINFAVDTTRRKGDVGSLGWMLANRALIEYQHGRLDQAKATFAEFTSLWPTKDPWLEAWIAEEEGDRNAARRLAEESVAVQRTSQVRPFRVAYALAQLGRLCLAQDDAVAARVAFDQSIAAARQYRHLPALRFGLSGLADVELVEGDHEAAVRLIEQLRATYPAVAPFFNDADGGGVDEPWWRVATSNLLGVAARLRGDLDAARRHHSEAVGLAQQFGYRPALASALEFASSCLTAAGDAGRAAQVLGAAAAVREAIGYPPPLWERARLRESTRTARTALGSNEFEQAVAAGRAMTTEDAANLCLSPD